MASRAASRSGACASTMQSRKRFLALLAPLAASVAAAEEAAERRDQVRDALGRDLEAARYAADRAFRQYDAADPANRLVAGELEARWNQALVRVADVESKIVAHETASPTPTIDPAALALLGLQNGLVGPDDGRAIEEAHRAHSDPRNRGRYRR